MFWLGCFCFVISWFVYTYSLHKLINGPLRTWGELRFYTAAGWLSMFEMFSVFYFFNLDGTF